MSKGKVPAGVRPFWFWNGDMREEEMARQIREMKEKNIPGFLIHPRQGMELPYMSREYFDRVKTAVRLAKELDMEVWIYDEYPYPSGICGGEVLEDHPEFLSKRLRKEVRTVEGPMRVLMDGTWGKLLLARAYPVKDGKIDLDDFIDLKEFVGTAYQQEIFQYSGLTQYNKKRYFTGDAVKRLDWQAPEGTYRVYLITECVTEHFKYFENFIDTMNPAAIRRFIELTHERYKKEVGEEFGRTIKGFFSDEAAPFPETQPWSPLLAGEVQKRCGLDLINGLPALWEDAGERTAQVRYAYWNTATDCFIEAYDKQIHQWCKENGLLYIGEKPIMRSKQLQHFDIPGMDGGHQKVGSVANMLPGKYRANGKMVSSAAHFYDKRAALCEVGHSIGWGETQQDLKWIFDWLSVVGVDFLVIHGFYYTADALRKHDAPPSSFYQMPWWEDAGSLMEYAIRLGDFLKGTKRRVKCLMVDPVTSAWTSERADSQRQKEDFGRLQTQMMVEGLDYYIIDPELFAQGKVSSEDGRTVFEIHQEMYDLVVLPPVRNLEKEAGEKLLEFMQKGGQVCVLGTIPYEQIERDSLDTAAFGAFFSVNGEERFAAYSRGEMLTTVYVSNACLAGTVEDAVEWMAAHCPADWKIVDRDGLGRNELPMLTGTDEKGGERIFIVNTSAKAREIMLVGPAGEAYALSLEAYESRLLDEETLSRENKGNVEINLDREMRFSLTSLNALRLDEWEMELKDGQRASVPAIPLIDQMERGRLALPVRQKTYFGCPKELDFPMVEASYRMWFLAEMTRTKAGGKVDAVSQIFLMMEPGTFLGEWHIELNGQSIRESDFNRRKIYAGTQLAVDVTNLLADGENEIYVHVKTDRSFGGMRNPLYLCGNFAVTKTDGHWKLGPLPETARMDDSVSAGLPFYSGEIVWEGEVCLPEALQEDLIIHADAEWLTDSMRLQIGEYETKPAAWRPYQFRIPAGLLREGSNPILIRVRNTALPLFEGQRFDQKLHAYVDA